MTGHLDGGMDAWKAAGLPIETTTSIDLPALRELWGQAQPPLIIDARQRNEYHAGHIKGALNIELGELPEHLDGLPRKMPVVTVCASGMRATTAASILQRDGRDNVQVVDEEGAPRWISMSYPAETGEG